MTLLGAVWSARSLVALVHWADMGGHRKAQLAQVQSGCCKNIGVAVHDLVSCTQGLSECIGVNVAIKDWLVSCLSPATRVHQCCHPRKVEISVSENALARTGGGIGCCCVGCGLGGGRWRGRQQLRPGVVWCVWPVRVGVPGGSRGPLPASLLLGTGEKCVGPARTKLVRMSRVFKACMVRVWRSLSLLPHCSFFFFPSLSFCCTYNMYHFWRKFSAYARRDSSLSVLVSKG